MRNIIKFLSKTKRRGMLFALAFLLNQSHIAFCQNVTTFKIYFEDNTGKKDTLILGYANSATNGIDPEFGEKNLYNEPMDSIFDVFISDIGAADSILSNKTCMLLKKQIENKRQIGVNEYNFHSIIVKCKNYPVTISWDDPSAITTSFPYTLLTDWRPGSWFDAVEGYEQGPYFIDSLNNAAFDYIGNANYFIKKKETSDTVRFLYFSFLSKLNYQTISLVSDNQLEGSIRPFPNPTRGKLNIESPNYLKLSKVELYTKTGILINTFDSNSLDLDRLVPGEYLLSIYFEGYNKSITKKIIKL